jgi:hypothetical protein
MDDHERIWLQHPNEADEYEGRRWCEDKVWPDDPEDGEPTEYVRADLHAAALAEIERLRMRVENARLAGDLRLHDNIRNDALEEAAKVAETWAQDHLTVQPSFARIAAAIRALKGGEE